MEEPVLILNLLTPALPVHRGWRLLDHSQYYVTETLGLAGALGIHPAHDVAPSHNATVV